LKNLSEVDEFDVTIPSTILHLDHRRAKDELMRLDFQETTLQSSNPSIYQLLLQSKFHNPFFERWFVV